LWETEHSFSEDDDSLEESSVACGLGGLVKITLKLRGDDSVDRFIHPSELSSLLWHPGVGEEIERIVVHWEGVNSRYYDTSFVPWEHPVDYYRDTSQEDN
jgi:hypothetical protein